MKTSAVPRSGCRKTRNAGIAMSAAATRIVARRPMRSRRPARYAPSTAIMSTLLTSLNWKSRPPTVTDICAPNRFVPTSIVRVRSASTAT